jgi:hypothetical protein
LKGEFCFQSSKREKGRKGEREKGRKGEREKGRKGEGEREKGRSAVSR